MSHRRHAGRALAAIGLLAVAAVASAGPAGAAAKTITEFQIKSANNHPGDMVVGADNNVWFIDQVGNKIGHVTHAGVITGFFIPQKASNTVSLTEGPDGAVWFTEAGASMIGRLSSGLVFTHVLVPAGSSPRGITTGSDGNLYYTLYGRHEVGRLNPTTKATLNTFATLPSGAGPTRIASGPDGNLWVTETAKNEVARITVPGGVVTQVALPAKAAPSHIVAGPDGNMWVTEPGTNHVAKISTAATPAVTQISVPGGPTGITAGGDGNTMWVTQSTGSAVARVIISPQSVKSFATPTKKSGPGGVVTGGDGNVWFSENAADKIGRLNAVSGHSSYVIVEDGRFSPKTQGVPVSSGSTHKSTTVRWLFQGGKSHSVTDSSGMGLFDSTVSGPGTSFTHLFTTAGRFDYNSTAAGDTQTGVITVTPSAVKNGSNIDVTVATAFPAGVSVNIQVKVPGGGSFAPAPGGTNFSAGNVFTYTPSNGAGAYRFQVQTAANGHTSGFSPTVSVNF
jgi:streptogramin lyase